jgi:N-6 DNA Methylase
MSAALAIQVSPELRKEPRRDDVPERGSPMSAKVEAAAVPHRELLEALERLPSDRLTRLGARIAGGSPDVDRSIKLIAAITTIRAALGGAPVDASTAIRWFVGREEAGRGLGGARWGAPPDERLTALLPYVLDPFGETTRRALIAGRACARERRARKRLGSFYTPGDVARALADEVVTPGCRRVLDPAAGAGVFLRAAFDRLATWLGPTEAVRCLYGIDIDPAAVDSCALVLTHDWLSREPLRRAELPADRFDDVRSRLRCGNALELLGRVDQAELFSHPLRAGPARLPATFDAVLMNPPFARAGSAPSHLVGSFESFRAAANPAGVNLAWPFWELAAGVVSSKGRAGVVLPLSIAYLDGPVARATRGRVLSRGEWDLRFYDRTPDAVFGDDVKQRVAIAVRKPGRGTVRTSAMRRWSADRRAAALAGGAEGVRVPSGPGVVLKIGTLDEAKAVGHLRGLASTLGDAAAHVRLVAQRDLASDPEVVAVAPTAYNWIGAFRDPAVAKEARGTAAGKLIELRMPSAVLADAAYGLLASRVFLWWWRVVGDLFHVTRTTIADAPFPLHRSAAAALDDLARGGRDCWARALAEPVAATNRGVKTISYAPPGSAAELDVVDRAVGAAFGVGEGFVRFTRQDAERLRLAGRKP